jgi:cation diffusion facilitator CzcD-associated flavoprotein CzcO
MSMWSENMPEGMFLKSEPFASNLSDPTGRATLAAHFADQHLDYVDVGSPVPNKIFTAYGRWFQQRLVPHLEQQEVTALAKEGPKFSLQLSDSSGLTADRVVIATGAAPFSYVPSVLAELPSTLVSHSSAHRDFHQFSGRDVVVVGAGQGALETAALLHESGATVRVLVRGPAVRWNTDPRGRSFRERVRWPISPLGTGWNLRAYAYAPAVFRHLPAEQRAHRVRTVLGPAGAWWLRARVDGRFPVRCSSAIDAASPAGSAVDLKIRAADGELSTVSTEHVIAGTGYRVDLSRLPLLSSEVCERIVTTAGSPALSSTFESSVEGLYFVGLPAAMSFGPVQRFVAGAGFAARRVSGALSQNR